MKLKVRELDLESGKNTVLLSDEDCRQLGVFPHDRVKIYYKDKSVTAIVNTSNSMINRGEIGIFTGTCELLGVKSNDSIQIEQTLKPESLEFIKKKMQGLKLSKDEIYKIIEDIVKENISDIELSAYITSLFINELNLEETDYLTRAMVDTGETLDFPYPVVDVHSIGGVPGNKYALITVPIVAALGLKIPKTSSRAISSAAGTADVMEVLAKVDLKLEEIRKIVDMVGATLAWGGAVNLAPADDKIIKIEYLLRIDPQAQLLASVMAKKKALNIKKLLIDIPIGSEAKVHDEVYARKLARNFIDLGERLGINVECAFTYGGQPVGRSIGPALEAKEALEALEGKYRSNSLIEKSLELAGILLEMENVVKPGSGKNRAREILKNKKALNKFLEIVNAQGSKQIEKSEDIQIGKYSADMISEEEGYISYVSNASLVTIARILGAPKDKGAGIWVYKKIGDKVDAGENLLRFYSENKNRLEEAQKVYKKYKVLRIEGMVIDSTFLKTKHKS